MERALRLREGAPHHRVHEIVPAARSRRYDAFECDPRVVKRPWVDEAPATPAGSRRDEAHRRFAFKNAVERLYGREVVMRRELSCCTSNRPEERVARNEVGVERRIAPYDHEGPHASSS